MEKCVQGNHQRRLTQPADCWEEHIRFVPKPQKPFHLPRTSWVQEHLTSLATALQKELKRKVQKLMLFKSWSFTRCVERPVKDPPLWCIWTGYPNRSCVYYIQSSPYGWQWGGCSPTAQVSVLSDTICTGCMYDFTYNDKPSPSSSQEDSQKAHAYQLIPVSFLLFLKPKITFPLIHQP